MIRTIFLFLLCLFPALLFAQSMSDGSIAGKNEVINTECENDSVKVTVKEKMSELVEKRRFGRQDRVFVGSKNNSRKTVDADKRKKKRNSGFFIQGGVNMSLHK